MWSKQTLTEFAGPVPRTTVSFHCSRWFGNFCVPLFRATRFQPAD